MSRQVAVRPRVSSSESVLLSACSARCHCRSRTLSSAPVAASRASKLLTRGSGDSTSERVGNQWLPGDDLYLERLDALGREGSADVECDARRGVCWHRRDEHMTVLRITPQPIDQLV